MEAAQHTADTPAPADPDDSAGYPELSQHTASDVATKFAELLQSNGVAVTGDVTAKHRSIRRNAFGFGEFGNTVRNHGIHVTAFGQYAGRGVRQTHRFGEISDKQS